jgi:hypothetical protein
MNNFINDPIYFHPEHDPICYKSSKPIKNETQFSEIFNRCEEVLAEREKQYKGSADGMFEDIGKLALMLMPVDPTPGQESASVLLALKLVRMIANPKHEDSIVDAVNYLLWFHKELTKE